MIQPKLTEIRKAALAAYNLPPTDKLRGKLRFYNRARPRAVAIFLAREMTPFSLPQIGKFFQCDHTTVLHHFRAVDRRRWTQPDGNTAHRVEAAREIALCLASRRAARRAVAP